MEEVSHDMCHIEYRICWNPINIF